MIAEIPVSIVAEAENYWESEGFPLFRNPNDGDRVLFLSWSPAQERPVLLIRQPDGDGEYGEAASMAALSLPARLPRAFACEGETVGAISTGFTDFDGDHFSEVTFDEAWHAALFQAWLDKNGVAVCIRPSTAMVEEKLINDHAEMASFELDRSLRYAGFKAMGIRGEIRDCVAKCWREERELPTGKRILAGTTVTFPDAGALCQNG